ncbi:MAG: DivIVA domain-containing protein [Thermodesulfobacteriota bacterium]
MKITPMEIRSHHIKKTMRGYDVREVELLKDLSAEALEEANREVMRLEEKVHDLEGSLGEHVKNELMLRETITTAQKMVEHIKGNARKEAELIVAESKLRGEEIVRLAQTRATEIREEIMRLRRQRNELNTSIKAIIDYHSSTLLLDEEESFLADTELDKLKFLPK